MELEPPFSPSVKSYTAGLDTYGGMSNTQTLTAEANSETATMTLTGYFNSSGEIWMNEHSFSGSETISIPAPNTRFDLKITDNGISTTYSILVVLVEPDLDDDDPVEPIGG